MNIPKDIRRIYLASPYSHPDEAIMEHRFREVALATAYLMEEEGAVVYSPIVHSHIVAQHLDNHKDHVFWLTQDRSHIATCDELVVCKIDGWNKSFGVSWEIGLCNGLGIPVSYLEMDDVYAWERKKKEGV